MEVAQEMLSKYVGQLLYGCGNSDCREVLCATGRQQRNARARGYTPRSARAIALAVASGSRPQAHLCRWYRQSRANALEPPPEGPRDGSSFTQHLADTDSVRKACDHSILPTAVPFSFFNRVAWGEEVTLYQNLRLWKNNLDSLERDEPDRRIDEKVPKSAYDCIRAIIYTFRVGLEDPGPRDQWNWIYKLVSHGSVAPSPPNRHIPSFRHSLVWPHLLDRICDGPTFETFCRTISIMALPKYYEAFRDIFMIMQSRSDAREGEVNCYGEVFFVLLTRAFLLHWDGKPTVHLHGLAYAALTLLELATKYFSSAGRYIPAIGNTVDNVSVAQSFLAPWPKDHVHLLCFEHPFHPTQKALYLRSINFLRMNRAYQIAAEIRDLKLGPREDYDDIIPRHPRMKYLEEPYFLLSVSRDHVIEDAFDQLWQRRSGELLRPLRVRLTEVANYEGGQDLGGVQIEFFNLVCRELLQEDFGMFTTDNNTGFSHFRAGSLQPLYKFELCGLLFGLAMYNGVALPVTFPPFFYRSIMETIVQPNLNSSASLETFPDVVNSLKAVSRGEAEGEDYALPLEANGLRLSVVGWKLHRDGKGELLGSGTLYVNEATRMSKDSRHILGPVDVEALEWPGWKMIKSATEPMTVNAKNNHSFVQIYLKWLASISTLPQLIAFQRGFFTITARKTTRMLSPSSFQAILEGSRHLDINVLREASTYDDFDPTSDYIKNFWAIVTAWAPEKQKRLFKFVTAAERVPCIGAAGIQFLIQRDRSVSLESLPSSSTCFSTLKLPEYESAEMLEEKLSLALELGLEGFGVS